jgi:hypothetical protein
MLSYLLTVRVPYFPDIFNKNFQRSSKPKYRIKTGPAGLHDLVWRKKKRYSKMVGVPIFNYPSLSAISHQLSAAVNRRLPFPPNFTNIKDLILHPLNTSLKSSVKFQGQAPFTPFFHKPLLFSLASL